MIHLGVLFMIHLGVLFMIQMGCTVHDTPGCIVHDTLWYIVHDTPGRIVHDTPGCIFHDTLGCIGPFGFSVSEITPKHRTDNHQAHRHLSPPVNLSWSDHSGVDRVGAAAFDILLHRDAEQVATRGGETPQRGSDVTFCREAP